MLLAGLIQIVKLRGRALGNLLASLHLAIQEPARFLAVANLAIRAEFVQMRSKVILQSLVVGL